MSCQPLKGIRVLEFGHMVMGPSCGLVLADLGAEVIKIEPVGTGDKTRRLQSFGAGFFCTYNRNKKSFAVDFKSEQGKRLIFELAKTADVVTENFRTGLLEEQGYGYQAFKQHNPGIIYCSMSGFLSGPYANRAALDEVVQMMGGLAYMTGSPGKPSRAGASVNDIMGGMFAAIGILAAVIERSRTGVGAVIKSGLYENCALLMGQHMATSQRTGNPSQPLSERKTQPWMVYDLFTCGDDKGLFIGLISDKHWQNFCRAFDLHNLLEDAQLATVEQRVAARAITLPLIANCLTKLTLPQALAKLESVGCPFAPVATPEDLLDDPHLNSNQALLSVELEPGKVGKLPNLPIEYNHSKPNLALQPPRAGEHSGDLLAQLGYSPQDIASLIDANIVSSSQR